MTTCPDWKTVGPRLPEIEAQSPTEFHSLAAHLQACLACKEQFEEWLQDPETIGWRQLGFTSRSSAQADSAGDAAGPDDDDALRYPFAPPAQSGHLGRVGDYQVAAFLGRGAMGAVFKAYDPALCRWVALKMPRPTLAESPQFRKRFEREARAAAAVQHPDVVTIYHVVAPTPAFPVPYLVLEYVAGEPLNGRLARQACLPPHEAVAIAQHVATALAAVHAHGLVHRDVKPSNILLDLKSGRARLTDFGLARGVDDPLPLTRSRALIGTPAYMAPEQAQGEAADARADLFSLGCVLYHMLTGAPPFQAPTLMGILQKLAVEQPVPPNQVNAAVPAGLSDLVLRLLAKQPKDRPATAAEVAHTLQKLSASLPPQLPLKETLIPERPNAVAPAQPSRSAVWRRWGRRRVLVLGMAAVFGLLVLTYGLTHFPAAPPPTVPEPPAAAGFHGWIDVRIWSKANGQRRNLGLRDEGALPLRTGDQVRAEAEVEPPGYLYVFWIDTEGQVDPIYPWKRGWGTRPIEEQPRARLGLPEVPTQGADITGAGEGMETLLLLVRETPLPLTDDELKRLLADLPPQRPMQNHGSAVWFENGEPDRKRKANFFDPAEINDPVLQVQRLVQDRLQPFCRHSWAVSFAKVGK